MKLQNEIKHILSKNINDNKKTKYFVYSPKLVENILQS
jgi:hypothetical protein